MRAAVTWESGGKFDVRETDLAPPGPTDVRVRLRAAGVCATDLALTTVFGQPTPVVLGHEGAGEVVEVGSDVRGVSAGDRVVVLWVQPCGECLACRRGDEYLCAARRSSSAQASGGGSRPRLTVDGTAVLQGMGTATFAEETIVPENGIARLDADVPFPVAALLVCAVPTGFGAAVRSARVGIGDAVAVVGCGAVGLSAVMGAVVAGAGRVLAVDPLAARRELALSLGASEAVAPDEFAAAAGLLDVAVDAVGRPATIRSCWDAVRRGGTVTVVGAGHTDEQVQFSAYELFHDDKRITGSWHGGMSLRSDLDLLVSLWRAGRLPVERLIDGTAPLGDINAIAAAQAGGAVVRTVLSL